MARKLASVRNFETGRHLSDFKMPDVFFGLKAIQNRISAVH